MEGVARRELHALADQLRDEHVAEVVALARWLVSSGAAVSLDDLLALWPAAADEEPRA